MGVTPKVYTREDIKNLSTEALRTASIEILKAFNEGDRKDMKLWEIYHEATLKLENAKSNVGSQSEWRQKLADASTAAIVEVETAAPEPAAVPAAPVVTPAAPAPTPSAV